MTNVEETEVIRLMDRVTELEAEIDAMGLRIVQERERSYFNRCRELEAELATANEVIRQIAERFGIADVRHILEGLAEVQADNARLRTALQDCGKYMGEACYSATCQCPAGIARRALSSAPKGAKP